MVLAADLTAREAEIVRVLRILAEHRDKFVVVGGYAVNALTSHRFSVDCDMVLAQYNLPIIERILGIEAYSKRKTPRQVKSIRRVRTEEFSKLIGGRSVSLDLFINRLVCRQTAGGWTYQLIKRNSFESDVVGLTGSARAFVPRRELLIAMKVHAGRGPDLRDIVMLSERADWNLVSEFADTGIKEKAVGQIANAIRMIKMSQFSSSLRAEFALRADVTPLIQKSTEGLSAVRKLLSSRGH